MFVPLLLSTVVVVLLLAMAWAPPVAMREAGAVAQTTDDRRRDRRPGGAHAFPSGVEHHRPDGAARSRRQFRHRDTRGRFCCVRPTRSRRGPASKRVTPLARWIGEDGPCASFPKTCSLLVDGGGPRRQAARTGAGRTERSCRNTVARDGRGAAAAHSRPVDAIRARCSPPRMPSSGGWRSSGATMPAPNVPC